MTQTETCEPSTTLLCCLKGWRCVIKGKFNILLVVRSWLKNGEKGIRLSSVGFPSDSKAVLHHPMSTCRHIHLSMPEGEGSIILNNWTQIALGEVQKAVGRKDGLQTLAVLSAERLWSAPRGVLFLAFLLANLPFLSIFLLGSNIDLAILLTAPFLPILIYKPIFIVRVSKMTNSHSLVGDKGQSLVKVGSGTRTGWVEMQMWRLWLLLHNQRRGPLLCAAWRHG